MHMSKQKSGQALALRGALFFFVAYLGNIFRNFFCFFEEYQSRILVSTNLFGRGVDIERVNIVINFDMPTNSNEYLHRVGRAGRFGTKGLAITFVCGDEDKEVLKDTQS